MHTKLFKIKKYLLKLKLSTCFFSIPIKCDSKLEGQTSKMSGMNLEDSESHSNAGIEMQS